MHLESLSNGLGAQSVVLLVMACRREIPATVSLTADTGWENDRTWSTGRKSSSLRTALKDPVRLKNHIEVVGRGWCGHYTMTSGHPVEYDMLMPFHNVTCLKEWAVKETESDFKWVAEMQRQVKEDGDAYWERQYKGKYELLQSACSSLTLDKEFAERRLVAANRKLMATVVMLSFLAIVLVGAAIAKHL